MVARHTGDFCHVVRQSELEANANFIFRREGSVNSSFLCFVPDLIPAPLSLNTYKKYIVTED